LRAWGDFVAPSLRSEDPLLTRAFANRILGALFHNDGFLRAAKPEHLDLLYYTPFVDLSYTHLFKESNVPQIGNFMAAAGFSEIDESGQKTGEFDPSQVDMALLNLAEIDMQLWADGRNQGAYLEWIRKLKKADGARGAIIIALQEKEMSLRTVKELMGKFDYLLKDDQKPYERFFMSLATPSEMARFRGVRASGSLVVPAIRQALSEGALSAEIWETYLKPAGIDQELGEFVTQPPPPEKIARLIINALWGRNKELKRLKLKPGDLIDSLLGEFRQARDYPLSRELVAFAGLKVMENGSLAEDVPNKEGRRWGDWLPEEARAEIAELLMQPGGFFEIADKFDIDKIVDTAIRAYIKAEERGDLYKVWTDFFVISDNLTDLKGRRLSDLDPLRDYMRGDGVDPIKDPLKHAARDGVIITDPDAIRITEWYLLTHDDDWVDDNARVGAHYAQILTSIDKARIFESLGEREARLIIGEAREDFEHRVGAWWLPRWWFRLKMWPLFGVVDAMKKEEKETAGGSAFRNGLRMVFSAGPTGIFGKILEIPVLPTSLLDASMMAAVGGFCTGLGWPTIPAYLVGGLAAKLGYNFSLSALVRAGLRSSRCPAFLRTWDYPYDPDGIISKKIIEDYTNVFTKPR
jgi:hypothetical protein